MSQYGDEPCTHYEMRERVARKEHVCCACGEKIIPGMKYGYVFLIHDGDTYTYKRCPRCQMIFVHLSAKIRGEGDYEEFCDERLNCGHGYEENWDEPPPEHNERVCQGYIRPATIFVNNATDGLGDEPEKKR